MTFEEIYKDRLQRAKQQYDAHRAFRGFQEMLEYIFPEFKDTTDDAKVKRTLTKFLEAHLGDAVADFQAEFDGVTVRRILDWLDGIDPKSPSQPVCQDNYNTWNSAADFIPQHLQRCLCYDRYLKGVYCYVYDNISKYWCTQTTTEHDPDGENHVCDYADYRVTAWMTPPKAEMFNYI